MMKKYIFNTKFFLILSMLLCPYYFSLIVPDKLPFPQLPLEFSEENLIKVIKESNIVYKDIFLAQIIQETFHYTSDVFIKANNLCGMKVPKSRSHLSIGSYKGYALYPTWIHSVDDYALWQMPVVEKYKTKRDYLLYLNRVYAVDSFYDVRIKAILKKNEEYFNKVFELK